MPCASPYVAHDPSCRFDHCIIPALSRLCYRAHIGAVMSGPYRVGIIGLGVAGATAAHLLAKAGHVVTLFERAQRVGPVGAGVLLQPSGQLVLKDLGLLER